jgi:hypothetical protein
MAYRRRLGDGPPTTSGHKTFPGYFGYKVLAVSYGGTLILDGYKGTPQGATSPADDTSCGRAGIFDASQNKVVYKDPDEVPTSTGCAWLRLAANLPRKDNSLVLSASTNSAAATLPNRWFSTLDYKAPPTEKDPIPTQVVVTTTDYLPRHSELLTISKINGTTLFFQNQVQWPHNGQKYPVFSKLGTSAAAVKLRLTKEGMDPDLIGTGASTGAETRAAVALLTRSIRIVSAGDKLGEYFKCSTTNTGCTDASQPPADSGRTCLDDVVNGVHIKQAPGSCYYFGAHTVIRQGFKSVQIQGVEFVNMGQGGKLGHYPVHFHMARQVPKDTYIKDSVINESMTRWIVLHSTQGVLLQRNIGYKSIGHGFFLEDGTEVDNKFFSNLGIFARAAIDNADNDRKVPGIFSAVWTKKSLTDENDKTLPPEAFPFRSDYDHPAVFWIANGWNDFIGNMAAGAGACGTAYWLVPVINSDMVDVIVDNSETDTNVSKVNVMFNNKVFVVKHMKWPGSSFAGLQQRDTASASAPFKSFFGNYATTTMNSFSDVGNMAVCHGVLPPGPPFAGGPAVLGIKGNAPVPITSFNGQLDPYYPRLSDGGHQTVKCPVTSAAGVTPVTYDCSKFISGDLGNCDNGPWGLPINQRPQLTNCAVLVLDHYTTSFHWAQTNFAAIWSRPKWFLLTNGFVSDVQNGGLTSFTSGNYARSSVILGDWALARTTVFVGNTQPNSNVYAMNAGPFNGTGPEDPKCDGGENSPKQYCLSAREGVSLPLDNFGVSQRLFSIYDGPMYEDSNAFLDITTTPCPSCTYAGTPGIRKQASLCYLPNAAIAWKQPNGFFYPPTFHSSNLFFGNVEIRHYVIDALFKPNTYLQDDSTTGIANAYCPPKGQGFGDKFFEGFTDIDRQTELNDDDGTLTGLTNAAGTGTISVNPARFFEAPVQTAECLSNLKVQATPVNQVCADKTTGKLAPTSTPTTAVTSPYDYVTTVVYPECGLNGSSRPNPGRCKDFTNFDAKGSHVYEDPGKGGDWSQVCTDPFCYGVPLYRQLLTGTGTVQDKAKATREANAWFKNNCNDKTDININKNCRWPFVRMGGQSTYQRSSMTANHGVYYLDTSVSATTQNTEKFSNTIVCPPKNDDKLDPNTPCGPRSVNLFTHDSTYYIFFIFAKNTTRQTYQIYVGPGFKTGDLAAVRVNVNNLPAEAVTNVTWPVQWEKHYNDAIACQNSVIPGSNPPKQDQDCGILQVTVDFKGMDDFKLKPANGLCLPSTFCKATGDACGCALDKLADPMVKANSKIWDECDRSCQEYAVKDLDFPIQGPLGFSFKMPSDFTPDDKGLLHRPAPTFFPPNDTSVFPPAGKKFFQPPDSTDQKPDWLTLFLNTAVGPEGTAGNKPGTGPCAYSSVPGTAACPMPTTPPVQP